MNAKIGTYALALLALAAHAVGAQEVRGGVELQARLFPHEPAFSGQRPATVSPSLAFAPELLHANASGTIQLTVSPFLRIDGHDSGRTHADLREASVEYFGEGWTLQAGLARLFWGKAESNHLVDIVNQTDAVEDLDGEDKLGQPMVALTIERSWGAVDLLAMPFFRQRTFPGNRGRLRGPWPILTHATFESDLERWHPDVATRLTLYRGGLDLGLAAFHGTSREPTLGFVETADGGAIQPHYSIVSQLSADAQWTAGATLWKLEALVRSGHGRTFGAAVAGVEHTFFQVGPGLADVGVLAEVHVDGRDETAPFTAFDRDVFLGARWALNDDDDTSVVGGPVVDWRSGETLAFVEATRRIGSRWVARLEGRWLMNTDAPEPLWGLRRDDHFAVQVSRYF